MREKRKNKYTLETSSQRSFVHNPLISMNKDTNTHDAHTHTQNTQLADTHHTRITYTHTTLVDPWRRNLLWNGVRCVYADPNAVSELSVQDRALSQHVHDMSVKTG